MEKSSNSLDIKTYSIVDDDSIDWNKIANVKKSYMKQFDDIGTNQKKIRKKVTNYTPPKKKRKK